MSPESPLTLPLVLASGMLLAIPFIYIPFFRRILSPQAEKARFAMLDGYRGFLALGVFVDHSYLAYIVLRDGGRPGSVSFFNHLGEVSVAQFFLITGFLFWGKALDKKIDPVRHYLSRVWRLGPVYLLAASVILVLVTIQTSFSLRVHFWQYVWQVVSLYSLGALTIVHVNGVDTGQFSGVRWTLHYEWCFYLALPFLAVLATHRRFLMLLVAFALTAVTTQVLLRTHLIEHDRLFGSFGILLFLAGMSAAHLVRLLPAGPFRSPLLVPLLLGVFALLVFSGNSPDPHALPFPNSPLGVALNFLLFLPIAFGNSLWGLLRLKVSRFLSTISYSIYLLNPYILLAFRSIVFRSRPVTSISVLHYWLLSCALLFPLLAIAALSYRLLEYPFLHRRDFPFFKPTSRPAPVPVPVEIPA